jgi:HK97 family phage major capsid protein
MTDWEGSAVTGTLAALERRRDAIKAAGEAMLLEARADGVETLDDGRDAKFRAMQTDLADLEYRIDTQRAEAARMGRIPTNLARAAQTQTRKNTVSTTHVTFEPLTYRRGENKHSYMRDLIRLQLNRDDDGSSRDRLMRHAHEVATSDEYTEFRDLDRVDGSGGYAVPPAWLMTQYIELARPGRAFANLCQRQQLPGGTDSINIPKLLTGTATAIQTADNTPVTQVDLTDTFVNAPVRTIAGQEGLAIQLIDQSPIAFDDVVFRDLVASHAATTDHQVIQGSGTNGEVLGTINTPNILTIAATSADIKGVYSAIANAVQTIHTTRFLPPDVIVMHPRRWGWFLSLLDQQQRPLFLPVDNAPMNAAGILTDVDSQQVVGRMHGLPIVTDPNLPVNLGTGNNEDPIFVMRASDLVLFESGIRARVIPETKAQTLTVILQVYSYISYTAARFPQSVCEISGLVAPTF